MPARIKMFIVISLCICQVHHTKMSTKQQYAALSWVEYIKFWYPEFCSKTCFIPPVLLEQVPTEVRDKIKRGIRNGGWGTLLSNKSTIVINDLNFNNKFSLPELTVVNVVSQGFVRNTGWIHFRWTLSQRSVQRFYVRESVSFRSSSVWQFSNARCYSAYFRRKVCVRVGMCISRCLVVFYFCFLIRCLCVVMCAHLCS